MSRIEADAREILLRRRHTLSHAPSHPCDPAARWRDWESTPTPPPEAVRRELADIDAALARIQEGRYGICVNCGGSIGLQRLRAVPEARYCMACSGHVGEEG